jgi:hypothetical protein
MREPKDTSADYLTSRLLRPTSLSINLAILLASLALSFATGEVALRLLDPAWVPRFPIACPRPDLYQQVARYGYRLWPSRSAEYLYPRDNPRKLSLVSNSDGFRSSREFHQPDPRPRVVVLGDSFVFGEGVEESERFTNVLETMQPGWRVDNLGMTGYGPDLMYRALEAVGLSPVPDVVVLAIYTDDFRRVAPLYTGVGFPIPRFKLEDGALITIPYPEPRFWDRSWLVQAVRHLYWSRDAVIFDLNEAILDRFLRLAQLRHFSPAIIFLPGRQDTRIDKKRRAWLKQYAERNATPFLDLTEPLHGAGVANVFIPGNWHLNPKGHQIIASELREFLARDVLRVDRRDEG